MDEERARQQQQHPFDPRVSRKDPFPSFDAAMAAAGDDDDDDDGGDHSADELTARAGGGGAATNLNWSIDSIAELKPAVFSPLPEQKAAAAAAAGDASEFTPTTAAKRAQFFEDEAQYKVLETPSPLVRQQQQQQQQRREPRAALPPPSLSPPPLPPPAASAFDAAAARRVSRLLPGASAASDLHSRCQDAIAFFGDRLRERQRKISRLQLPQRYQTPPRAKSATKRLRDSEFPWRTPSGASELKGIHPRASASETRGRRPGSAPSSGALKAPGGGPTPTTPARKPVTAAAVPRQRAEPEFSFGDDSPISPIAPLEQRSPDALLSPILRRADATPSFESPPSFSDDDKENSRKRRQQPPSTAGAADSRASASSLTLSSASASWGKATESSLSLQSLAMLRQQQDAALPPAAAQRSARSIAQRQESFVAAIEAEAQSQ